MPAMKPPVGSDLLLREAASFNQTVQRTGASRFAQRQIERHRRLAPVADLLRSLRGFMGLALVAERA